MITAVNVGHAKSRPPTCREPNRKSGGRKTRSWAVGCNTIAVPVAAGVFAGWGLTLRPEVAALTMSAPAWSSRWTRCCSGACGYPIP